MHSVSPCLVTGAQTMADRKWPGEGGGGDRGPLEITKKIIEHNIAHRHSPSKFEKTINPLYYIILNMILRRQRKAK